MKWYNDITKLFMSRGYLDKGQTIDEKNFLTGRVFTRTRRVDGEQCGVRQNAARSAHHWYEHE